MMKISSEILQIGSYENFKILLKLLKQEKRSRFRYEWIDSGKYKSNGVQHNCINSTMSRKISRQGKVWKIFWIWSFRWRPESEPVKNCPVSFHSRSPVKVWTGIKKLGSFSLKPINQTIISIFQETDKTEDRKSPPWSQCKSYKYRLVYFNDISRYWTV